MKRILGTLFGTALLVLAVAAPAAADYPPSPTQSPTRGPTQSPTVSPTVSPTQSFTQTPTPSVEGSETHSPSASSSVLGETVTVSPGAGGTAFTGSDVTGPLALGGILLVLGLALLYVSRRRAAASDR
jgi:LPXTG-motif cell wall-anchored protein